MENVDDDSSAAGLLANNVNRNKTLELLQDYIQRQRTLLERTQADIDKLKQLKQCAADDPRGTLSTILNGNTNNDGRHDGKAETEPKDNARDSVWVFGSFSKLVEDIQGGNETTILKSINWELFKGHDTTPFLDMQTSSRNAHPSTVFPPAPCMLPPPPPNAARNPPPPCSSLYPPPRDSHLRSFVREKRAQLVEPVLAKAAAFLATFGPDSDCECDVQQFSNGKYNRSKAHGSKADEARRRKQEEAAMVRPRGPGGVFIKRDKAPANGVPPAAPSRSKQKRSMPRSPMGEDGTASSFVPAQQRRRTSSTNSIPTFMDIDEGPLATCKPKRTRRPSTRFLSGTDDCISRSRNTSGKSLDLSAPVDPPALPKIKLTIRLPPRSSLSIRKPDLSPVTSPSSTTSLSLRTASTSTSTSTNRQSFSPPAFAFTPKEEDADEDMDRYHYSTGEEEGEESQIAYDDDAMSISTVTSVTRSRSRTRSETPQHFGYKYASPYGGTNGGKFTATSNTSASPSGSVNGRRKANGNANGREKGKAKSKPKPETFNMPWSVSEQHLLEKLLEDYPDGVRNRWAKISEAMDGRRTPRQVASRVQKYFLKLKKFGVDVPGK